MWHFDRVMQENQSLAHRLQQLLHEPNAPWSGLQPSHLLYLLTQRQPPKDYGSFLQASSSQWAVLSAQDKLEEKAPAVDQLAALNARLLSFSSRLQSSDFDSAIAYLAEKSHTQALWLLNQALLYPHFTPSEQKALVLETRRAFAVAPEVSDQRIERALKIIGRHASSDPNTLSAAEAGELIAELGELEQLFPRVSLKVGQGRTSQGRPLSMASSPPVGTLSLEISLRQMPDPLDLTMLQGISLGLHSVPVADQPREIIRRLGLAREQDAWPTYLELIEAYLEPKGFGVTEIASHEGVIEPEFLQELRTAETKLDRALAQDPGDELSLNAQYKYQLLAMRYRAEYAEVFLQLLTRPDDPNTVDSLIKKFDDVLNNIEQDLRTTYNSSFFENLQETRTRMIRALPNIVLANRGSMDPVLSQKIEAIYLIHGGMIDAALFAYLGWPLP